jgi:LacI family transcriptional regulator
MQKPTTIKEIATRLNVSVSTVSRALHDHPSIGLKTRNEVKKLAKELHYEPNQAAISFKQGRTMTIGVILPNLREEYFSMAINGIEDVATANQYTVLIGQSHDDVKREQQIVETMRRHRVDGVIASLATTSLEQDHFSQLDKYKIPVVFFDRVPEDPKAYTVSCSLENSSMELVNWLVKHGHHRIGFIKGPDALIHSEQRLIGYRQALLSHSIKPDEKLIVSTNLSTEQNRDAMEKLLSLPDPPKAVIAFNDYVALDAIKLSREKGLKINRDIFFASYANLPVTGYMDDPPAVSVEQFPYAQAEKATEILMQLIRGENKEAIPLKTVMESKVVERQS